MVEQLEGNEDFNKLDGAAQVKLIKYYADKIIKS
jgi:hypothetical protein